LLQYAELDARPVDRSAHNAVDRVDFADKMTLAEPADRRVAGHLADRRPLVGQEKRARTEARRRLAAGCMNRGARCRGFT
jgi:hypothetical protein